MFNYKPRRTRNIYKPGEEEPFKLSRSKLEDFVACPRCFYIDRRLGISKPPTYPYSLNIAVDALLKREFDKYREAGMPHPKMIEAGIDAIPFSHPDLEIWRDGFRRGASVLHAPTNLLISGGIDELWRTSGHALIVVDYKAGNSPHPTNFESDQYSKYKRQLEIYKWIFSRLGFFVAKNGYLVHCSANSAKDSFDDNLSFDVKIIDCELDDSWIEETIINLHKCLNSPEIPPPSENCDFCNYNEAIGSVK